MPNSDGISGYQRSSEGDPSDNVVNDTPRTLLDVIEIGSKEKVPLPREHDALGDDRGDSARANQVKPRRRGSGGFSIEWDNAGQEAPRSNYIESELTILINLDHPEIAAAYSAGDSSPLFRMLAFEAAAQEYCYATAYQQLEEDPTMDGSDTVQYVRATIDLLTRDVADVVTVLNWGSPPPG